MKLIPRKQSAHNNPWVETVSAPQQAQRGGRRKSRAAMAATRRPRESSSGRGSTELNRAIAGNLIHQVDLPREISPHRFLDA